MSMTMASTSAVPNTAPALREGSRMAPQAPSEPSMTASTVAFSRIVDELRGAITPQKDEASDRSDGQRAEMEPSDEQSAERQKPPQQDGDALSGFDHVMTGADDTGVRVSQAGPLHNPTAPPESGRASNTGLDPFFQGTVAAQQPVSADRHSQFANLVEPDSGGDSAPLAVSHGIRSLDFSDGGKMAQPVVLTGSTLETGHIATGRIESKNMPAPVIATPAADAPLTDNFLVAKPTQVTGDRAAQKPDAANPLTKPDIMQPTVPTSRNHTQNQQADASLHHVAIPQTARGRDVAATTNSAMPPQIPTGRAKGTQPEHPERQTVLQRAEAPTGTHMPPAAAGGTPTAVATKAPTHQLPLTLVESSPVEKSLVPTLPSDPDSLSLFDQPRMTGHAPFGQTAMRPDLAVHVARQLVEALTQSALRPVEIALSPQELGRVRLSLVAEDGKMTVHILAERPDTIDLMRRHIDQLGQSFRALGYDTIAFSFNEGSDAGTRENPNHNSDSVAHTSAPSGTVADDAVTPSVTIGLNHTASAGVDIRL